MLWRKISLDTMKSKRNKEEGFTLIEVLISLTVLIISINILTKTVFFFSNTQSQIKQQKAAIAYAEQILLNIDNGKLNVSDELKYNLSQYRVDVKAIPFENISAQKMLTVDQFNQWINLFQNESVWDFEAYQAFIDSGELRYSRIHTMHPQEEKLDDTYLVVVTIGDLETTNVYYQMLGTTIINMYNRG